MKYLILILLLISTLGVDSCIKYIHVDNSIKYTLDGFHDITIDQNDSVFMYVNAQLLSGDPANEYVAVKIIGLPDKVTINTDSITFRPNYSFRLDFHANYPGPGKYPVSARISSPTMGTRIYTFDLTVTSLVDCSEDVTKNMAVNTYGPKHQTEISGDPSSGLYTYIFRTGCDTVKFRIMKDSVELAGSDPIQHIVQEFSAVVNCNDNTLNVYHQKAAWHESQDPITITGVGQYVPVGAYSVTVTINDTAFSGSQIVGANSITIY